MRPAILSLVGRVAAGSLRVWLMAGILLRVTRLLDAWHPLAIVFYTTPWPTIAAGLALLALHAKRSGHRHALHRNLVLTGGALFVWVALSWHGAVPPAGPVALKVVQWNVGRPAIWRLDYLASWIRSQEADLIVLAEANTDGKATLADWAARFPGYQAEHFQAEMVCLVRGEVIAHEQGLLHDGSYYGLLRVRVRGREHTVLQADIFGSPLARRREPLVALADLAETHAGESLLILGDFNTPRDSVFFDRFRAHFTNAFAAAGAGWGETWPSPLPVLTLDHLWTSLSLQAVRCRVGWTLLSDHRPVVTELGAR